MKHEAILKSCSICSPFPWVDDIWWCPAPPWPHGHGGCPAPCRRSTRQRPNSMTRRVSSITPSCFLELERAPAMFWASHLDGKFAEMETGTTQLDIHIYDSCIVIVAYNRIIWNPYPIGSMYAIYGNIYHKYTPNVSIYTIHGSYGYVNQKQMCLRAGFYGHPVAPCCTSASRQASPAKNTSRARV